MLKEVHNPRQISGEPRRRWFSSGEMDLVVWVSEANEPLGFQLCYDKHLHEKAITLRPGSAQAQHMAVDNGEVSAMRHKASPILVPDGDIDPVTIVHAFRDEAGLLPSDIVDYVASALTRAF
ncbi:MAG: hypothetical protein KDH99_01410 [Alcanivoracaceae bacterium]|nr:hypothetical protein [Alcanivoracaceae bacterium]